MDILRGSSIALPLPTNQSHHRRQRRLSGTNSLTSSESDRTRPFMAIPGIRTDAVPPALPPPRYIDGLDDGVDLSWGYQNEDLLNGKTRLAPIKPGSSLLGHHQTQLFKDDNEAVDMDMEIDYVSTHLRAARIPSQSQTPSRTAVPNLTRRPPSSSGTSQQLHGEHPLAQQTHHQSTHAYDQHLLLKIGKAHSPPSHSKPRHTSISSPKLSITTRTLNLPARPSPGLSRSLEPVTKWLTSPTSAVSPTSRTSWRECSMDPRSPSWESTSYNSGFDQSTSFDTRYNPRPSLKSAHNSEDTRSHSERGSYDSSVYTDAEPIYEPGERPRMPTHHGIKRRALSPAYEILYDHAPDSSAPRLQVRTDRPLAQSQPYKTGSLSSTASTMNHNLYSTPTTLLSAASSMTTAPFSETPTSSRMYGSPTSVTNSRAIPIPSLRNASVTSASKPSILTATTDAQSPLSKIGNHYICSCCPKKPKKFENEEQLRAHENEKQYSCAYCNNRFKNKNEAERHQNSLHLRNQSWSCATISTYQAAFHPSSLSNPRNLVNDTCGFCGEQFVNRPPDWEERIAHLTDIHKFGECNNKKKFYRADHFRQHLKHSHAGKTGKWTNILENNCQREEAVSESTSLSPAASEQSTSGECDRFTNPTEACTSRVDTTDESYER